MTAPREGWPKQIGSVWITRAHDLPSPAAPVVGDGGVFGATLSFKDQRLANVRVTLREKASRLPDPSFAGAVNVRRAGAERSALMPHPRAHRGDDGMANDACSGSLRVPSNAPLATPKSPAQRQTRSA